jgi:hypothetical protein
MTETWPTVSAEELAALRPTRDYDLEVEDEHERLREQWWEMRRKRDEVDDAEAGNEDVSRD